MSRWIEGISNNVEKHIQQEKRKHIKLSTAHECIDDKNAVFICGLTEEVSEALVAL